MLSLYTMHYWTDLRQHVTPQKCFLSLRLNNWKMFSSLWHLWTWGHKRRFWGSSECKTFILICCFAVEVVFFCFFPGFFIYFYVLSCTFCWAVQYVVYTNRLGHFIIIYTVIKLSVRIVAGNLFKVHVYCIHN